MASGPVRMLAAGLALAALAHPARTHAQTGREIFLSPARARADHGFHLSLLSYRYKCNAFFTHAEMTVGKGRIDFAYVTEFRFGMLCMSGEKPYGPEFAVTPLAAGRYEIYAHDRPACRVAPQPCEVAETPERVGTLTVGEGAAWFLRPPRVRSGAAFELQVLNEDVGSCNSVFSHTALSATDSSLAVSFLPGYDSSRACIQDLRPYGPSFAVAAGLKPGRYPVYLDQRAACEFTEPRCVVDPLPPYLRKPFDTLWVYQDQGVGVSPFPVKAPGSGLRRPAAGWTAPKWLLGIGPLPVEWVSD